MSSTYQYCLRLWAATATIVLVVCSPMTHACTSDRPGWATHRTLYVPFGLLSNPTAQDLQWKDALCCVYTHVVEIHSTQVTMQIYDGSRYTMRGGNSFADLAQRAMNDICAMSMGSIDCQQQSQCRNRAFRSVSTTSTCATVDCGFERTCQMVNGQPQCVSEVAPTASRADMCPLRDVCSRATTVQACRSSHACCGWSMFGQCRARQTYGCTPWQQVACGGGGF